MSGIGPELPPHILAKRKRKQDDGTEAAPATAPGAKHSPSPSEGEKRRRVIGPALPPAPLSERPEKLPKQDQESESDDDDGFGPPLPPNATDEAENVENSNGTSTARPEPAPSEEKLKRDDWMMMPPKQDDLAARMDPTKQRARGFNTGKGARGPPAVEEDSSAWNETPEQKQKRLANEMMGVSNPSSAGPQKQAQSADKGKDQAAAAKIREHTVSVGTCSFSNSNLLTRIVGEDSRHIITRPVSREERDRGRG